MPGSVTDKLDRVTDSSTGRPVVTTLAAPGKAIAAPSITVAAATNWTLTTKIHFAIYNTVTVAGVAVKDGTTQTDWTGTLSGTTISNLVNTGGTDRAYSAGAIVELTPTSAYAKELYDWAIVGHNQDGTHKAFTESNIVPTAAIQANAVTTSKIPDGAVTSQKAALTTVGADGTTLNPITTSSTDVASSSVTFTCAVASYLDVAYSCYIQTNGGSQATVSLNVDGTDNPRNLTQQNSSGSILAATNSRRLRITLAAGSHTIKLRAIATIASATVAYDPSWWGTLVSQ